MMKFMLAVLLTFTAFVGTLRAEPVSTKASPQEVMGALYDEFMTGGCHGGEVTFGEVKDGWVCYAKDCYSSFESEVKICKDHAQKAAIAMCERLSKDKSQCQLVGGDGQCCRKPLKD